MKNSGSTSGRTRVSGRLMCSIPAGRFLRGSELSPDEQPVMEVGLSAYDIDELPVTNGAYADFMADGGYQTPTLWTPAGWRYIAAQGITRPTYWDDPIWAADSNVPVTGVSWWEALAYARWAGCTLPTEAQWEYACRGPASVTYPWGEDAPDLTLANYAPGCEPVDRRPTLPDAHPRNVSVFGVRDMVGNFAEWCLDNYRIGYGSAAIADPVHLTGETDEHVVRGGSGLHDEDYLRGSARDAYPPGLRDNLVGFRCTRRTDPRRNP